MAGNTTINTFLVKGTTVSSTTTYAKLVDITDYPELLSPPEKIDISTMSSRQKKYAPGMIDTGDLSFGAIYDKTDYETLATLEEAGTEIELGLFFGGVEDGSGTTAMGCDGKFTFKGTIAVTPDAGSVGEARKMKITVYPTTDIEFSAS